jgi:hypothetical protein
MSRPRIGSQYWLSGTDRCRSIPGRRRPFRAGFEAGTITGGTPIKSRDVRTASRSRPLRIFAAAILGIQFSGAAAGCGETWLQPILSGILWFTKIHSRGCRGKTAVFRVFNFESIG